MIHLLQLRSSALRAYNYGARLASGDLAISY